MGASPPRRYTPDILRLVRTQRRKYQLINDKQKLDPTFKRLLVCFRVIADMHEILLGGNGWNSFMAYSSAFSCPVTIAYLVILRCPLLGEYFSVSPSPPWFLGFLVLTCTITLSIIWSGSLKHELLHGGFYQFLCLSVHLEQSPAYTHFYFSSVRLVVTPPPQACLKKKPKPQHVAL